METLSFHSLWTVIIFISFIGIFIWAYSKRREKEFDEAANMIFTEDKKETRGKGEEKK